MKSDWWEEKAESLQHAADTNDMKSFYVDYGKCIGLLNEDYLSYSSRWNYGIAEEVRDS